MKPASILVVEDEAIVALDLAQQLTELGYDVVGTAASGDDAVSQAHARRPSLVLMDIVLHGEIDGIEAAKQIGRGLGIPIVFLTAFRDFETARRVAETAPYGYITKPYQIKELRAAIEVALYKSSMERRLSESEQWFAVALRCVGDAVIATDTKARVRFLNPTAETLTGWSLEEARGRPIGRVLSLRSRSDDAVVADPARRALRENQVVGMDYGACLVARNGSQVAVDNSAAPIRDAQGHVMGAVFVMRDVSERVEQEDRLRASEERFRNVFDFAPAGMALVALDGRLLRVNASLCSLLGYTEAELLTLKHTELTYAADLDAERAQLYHLLTGNRPTVQFEKRYLHRDGRVVWALTNVSSLREAGEPVCHLYQIYDLTERKEAEYQLSRLAYFDPLTGLANRARLREELDHLMAIARRSRQQLAVAFMDLDRFKQINDSLGHEAGDELLKTVAQRLKSTLRETDCVARLGGDEFVLVLPEVKTAANIATVAEKVRIAVSMPMQIANHEVVITPSLGISLYPGDGDDPQTLLRCADNALYAAKKEGRNCVQFFRPELAREAEARLHLEVALRRAVANKEFYLEYQPIYGLDDGLLVGFEALLRWRRRGRVIGPASFIAAAEETGIILPLGEWVLREACSTAAGWSAPLTVNVNFSARQLREPNFADSVAAVLRDTGLTPARLCLELTESMLLQGNETVDSKLVTLKALGVALSIDDYGTGYSSLAYLKRFAPRSLKIDGLFVRDLDHDPNSAAIVSATIAMAHELGLKVVAECVESEAQLQRLRAFGCDAAQGFYLGRPLAAAGVPELIKRGTSPASP